MVIRSNRVPPFKIKNLFSLFVVSFFALPPLAVAQLKECKSLFAPHPIYRAIVRGIDTARAIEEGRRVRWDHSVLLHGTSIEAVIRAIREGSLTGSPVGRYPALFQ